MGLLVSSTEMNTETTKNLTKTLSKTELVDMELRGRIYGARFDVLHLESMLEARKKGLRDPHFKLFKNWFGEVDLLEGNNINVTYHGAFYDLKVAMNSYGLCPSIDWDFTETPNSQIEELKAGQLEVEDLIGVYRSAVSISPLQGCSKLVLRMNMCGVKKIVFGQLTDGDTKTLDKKRSCKVAHLISRPYSREMVEELEKSTQTQKLVLIANLAVEIDNLKTKILGLNKPQWPKIPCDEKVQTSNEGWVPSSHIKANRKPTGKNGKTKNARAKNGKVKRRGRV